MKSSAFAYALRLIHKRSAKDNDTKHYLNYTKLIKEYKQEKGLFQSNLNN